MSIYALKPSFKTITSSLQTVFLKFPKVWEFCLSSSSTFSKTDQAATCFCLALASKFKIKSFFTNKNLLGYLGWNLLFFSVFLIFKFLFTSGWWILCVAQYSVLYRNHIINKIGFIDCSRHRVSSFVHLYLYYHTHFTSTIHRIFLLFHTLCLVSSVFNCSLATTWILCAVRDFLFYHRLWTFARFNQI